MASLRERERRRTTDARQSARNQNHRGIHLTILRHASVVSLGGDVGSPRPCEKDFVGSGAYLAGMATAMELRHLRYFVAVAEEGSVTLAAQRRLHTAQPSLSRQLRELEREVGAQLLIRSTQGVELTPA